MAEFLQHACVPLSDRTEADEARAQGYDDRFLRMWEFYLAYCEGGFRERSIGVAHLLLGKPGHVRALAPWTRA